MESKSKRLYSNFMAAIESSPDVPIESVIGILNVVLVNLTGGVVKSIRHADVKGEGRGEGDNIASQESVKKLAEQCGVRCSLKKNGGVGISFDGEKWHNYAANELAQAISLLSNAPDNAQS